MAELFATTGDSIAHIAQQGDVWNAKLLITYFPNLHFLKSKKHGTWTRQRKDCSIESETTFKYNKKSNQSIQLYHTFPKMSKNASRDVPRCAGPQGLDSHLDP